MLRVFHHYFSGRKLGFFVVETFAIGFAGVAGAVAMAAAFAQPAARASFSAWPAVAAIVFCWVVAFQFALYAVDLYDLRIAVEDRRAGIRMMKAAGAGAIVVGAATALLGIKFPPGTLLGSAAGAVAGALLVRAAIRAIVGAPSRVLIVGDGAKAHAVAKSIEAGGEGAFAVVEMVAAPREGTAGAEPIDAIAARAQADFVVAALDDARGGSWVEELFRCRLLGMRVYDGAGFCERVLRRLPVAQLHLSELAFSDELTVSRARRFWKRAFDVTVASALLLAASPLIALVALAIKLDSKGPIFYRQERTGLGGREYRLWKFRSMRTDAEKNGAVWARENDDRVTRVGRVIRKARIDEIPQVLNVFSGEMSFVGPRPERPIFVKQLKAALPFYGLREAVKPGITGWAQIRYPYGASVEDARNKLEYDLYYVKNGSLFLDLAIIFHTVRHVLLGRGAR